MTSKQFTTFRIPILKFYSLGLLLLTATLLLVSCTNKPPSQDKQIKVVQEFFQAIMTHNTQYDESLSDQVSDSGKLWTYAEQAGLTKQLSPSYLDPYNFNSSYTVYSEVEENLMEEFRPIINYLQGYEMDDLTFDYNKELEVITVSIKPDRVANGIYFLNDPSTPLFFTFYVDNVKEDGVKIVSMACAQPDAVINKYEWYTKEALQDLKDQYGHVSREADTGVLAEATPPSVPASDIEPTAPPQDETLNDEEYVTDLDEPLEGDTPELEAILRSGNGTSLVKAEWLPGASEVAIPLHFGSVEAELLLGEEYPNGVKSLVVFPSSGRAWSLDPGDYEDSSAFDNYGDLQSGYRLQAGVYDFDGDGTNELLLAAGDLQTDSSLWVFSFDDAADPEQGNPLTQQLALNGQTYFALEGNMLQVPYGSQGLYEAFRYEGNKFVKVSE
ncbi:hypothetical protein F4V43_07505 [Paenibacillus spiritus]|uniref:Uncharacterized protein n=1 Tax=Paenibacillus spiritus TaxID=2496557 RepID=A0A5J5GD95_9BACL|nr:hypothetical protein [Paenibacillus spiritus]KAA9005908.1 hypothetical protein F4V43_07505 [Paenibacillus spiritus]